MGKYIIDEATLTVIADGIRDRTGITGTIEPEQMAIDIAALPSLNYTYSSYVDTEAARVAALAKAAMNSNTITFVALSDTHVLSTNSTAMAGLNSAVNGARIIRETIPVDFTAVLGDISFGASDDTRALHQANLLASRRAMGILSPDVVLEGNHDRGYNADAWLANDLLYRYVGRFNKNVTRPSTNADRGYCYMDLTAKKTRVIFMNTADLRDKDASVRGSCYISADQYSWLVSTLSGVGANTGWNILLLTHHPLHWSENMGNLTTLLDKYNSGGSGSVTVDGTTISYNFSGKNKAKLLCNIHGHTHNFISGRAGSTDIVRIGTPNAYFYRNNEYTGDYGESTTYNKTANSAKDTSFCVYVVDTSALTVKAFCYGAGYDRTVSLAEVLQTYTITNTLTATTTSNTATTITEKSAYTATLTANSGYELSSVKVTMGGTDITSSAYSNGKITISSVTGNIVITAVSTAVVVTIVNLVPTALTPDTLSGAYNGTGYKNNSYVSGANPTASKTGYVATGAIPIDSDNVNAIYVKGAEWASDSSCRLFFGYPSNSYGSHQIKGDGTGNNKMSDIFTFETLGTNYYKFTYTASGKLLHRTDNTYYFRISLKGTGENLVITYDQPIV